MVERRMKRMANVRNKTVETKENKISKQIWSKSEESCAKKHADIVEIKVSKKKLKFQKRWLKKTI